MAFNNVEFERWNDNSYLVEDIRNFDDTGGFPARNFTKGDSKLRKDAAQYVKNVPSKAKIRYDFTYSFSTFKPIFDIKRGDILNINVDICGETFTDRVVVNSVGASFKDGKWNYTIDFKEV
jgi:hypothetical protein